MARSTLWKHRKFRRLEMALKSKCIAAGVLECMWSCGYESGDDLLGTSEEVEKSCGWHGKRGALTPILLNIGWIDASADGYRIHDLLHHAPDYVQKRMRRERQRTSNGRTMDVHRPSTDPHSPTQPNPTLNPTLNPTRPTDGQHADMDRFPIEELRQITDSIGRIPSDSTEHAQLVRAQAAAFKQGA